MLEKRYIYDMWVDKCMQEKIVMKLYMNTVKPLYARTFQVKVKPGQEYKLEATLTDGDGNPLSDKTIEFYESRDARTWSKIATDTTDADGKATYTLSKSEAGDYYYKARFPGDDYYDASESNVEKVTVESAAVVEKGIPIYAIIALLLLLLLLFGAGEERRRRGE